MSIFHPTKRLPCACVFGCVVFLSYAMFRYWKHAITVQKKYWNNLGEWEWLSRVLGCWNYRTKIRWSNVTCKHSNAFFVLVFLILCRSAMLCQMLIYDSCHCMCHSVRDQQVNAVSIEYVCARVWEQFEMLRIGNGSVSLHFFKNSI